MYLIAREERQNVGMLLAKILSRNGFHVSLHNLSFLSSKLARLHLKKGHMQLTSVSTLMNSPKELLRGATDRRMN